MNLTGASLTPSVSPLALSPQRGGENVTKNTTRVGIVTIKELGQEKWLLRYWDSASGVDVRRRLTGLDAAEVKRIAGHLNGQALSETGYLPGKRKLAPTLKEGFEDCIKLSKQRPHVRIESGRQAGVFLDWMKDRFPRIQTWDAMRPAHLVAYQRDLEGRGLHAYTVRNRCVVVTQAWRFMEENYRDLVVPAPHLRLNSPPPTDLECLSPEEMSILFDWLKEKRPVLWAMGICQGLAGLRMLEVAALRRSDVDFTKGIVSIRETEAHTPKNRGSHRVIPVSGEVMEALRTVADMQKVVPMGGELFLNEKGLPWRSHGLSRKWQRSLLKASEETKVKRFGEIPAHRLRASFITMMDRAGVPSRVLKRYVGHSAGDILGEHYRSINEDDLRVVSCAVEGWRGQITGQKFGKILATSGE